MAVTKAVGADAQDYDFVVVGLGFAGIYAVYRYREMGYRVIGVDAASDVGGVWNHNRYPGARCDVRSIDYSYSFSDELQQEWHWTETFAAQPEILAYLRHVADRFDLRRDMKFNTRVISARFAENTARWSVQTNDGVRYTCRFLIMATGGLSSPKAPEFAGLSDFQGEWLQTSRWPHQPLSFQGKRVAVIGTGSSGVQCIPAIAEEAEHLTVFQRTAVFTSPARNGPIDQNLYSEIKARYSAYRDEMRNSRAGNYMHSGRFFDETPEAERRDALEGFWKIGGLGITTVFTDTLRNQQANDFVADFIRSKIRETVHDPQVAERLMPWDYPVGARRPCIDTNYYETFNRHNVELVDLRADPIERIVADGIKTKTTHHPLDVIVFALGFDAFTGPVSGIDLRNGEGENLIDRWRDGPRAFLGMMAAGYPNLFFITGPNGPSVLANMPIGIEHDVDWIGRAVHDLDTAGLTRMEATPEAQEAWAAEVARLAGLTLYGAANSWYLGANIPGKARVFVPYAGGFSTFRARADAVVQDNYAGFARR